MIGRKRTAVALALVAAGDSTFGAVAWQQARGGARRWAIAGVVLGGLIGGVAFAPASWLANRIATGTQQRLLLADARGTVWAGSAVTVLTGGPGSRDASSLPGRLDWQIGLRGLGFELRLRQACCLNGTVALRVQPGFGGTTTTLLPSPGWVGQWPSAWLAGLGTPWNTFQLGGAMRLSSPGLSVQTVQGRWRVNGSAELELLGASSRLSTLDPLGSYRVSLIGDRPVGDKAPPAASNTAADTTAGPARVGLATLEGALQLSGSGTWGIAGLQFRGEARANAADEAALANLLNIIGRRDGARSVIVIG